MFHYLALTTTFFIGINAALASSQVNVLDHYPQCDYQVLETVTESRKLTQQNGRLAGEFVDQAFNILVEKFRQRAKEIGAQGILLVDRKLELMEKESWTKSREKHSQISYTAELVSLCKPDKSLPKKVTAFNAKGKPQKVLDLGSIGGWQQEIEFPMPGQLKRETPQLTSQMISLKKGIYGKALGSKYDEVITAFGTPTFVMQINSELRMIAYGRRHWLIFESDKLVQASSDNPWFSTEFTNLLAFDERFEQQTWALQGKVKYRDKAEKAKSLSHLIAATDNKLVLSDGHHQLDILLDQYMDSKDTENMRVVVGFRLSKAGFEMPGIPRTDHSQLASQRIVAYLNDVNRQELTTDMLGVAPLASLWVDPTSDYLVFGPHLIVERTGTSVSKVMLLENVYSDNLKVLDTQWKFNGLSQGQSLDSVLKVLGDDAFHFDDMIEYMGEAFGQYLYFYKSDGEQRLLSSEISIY